MATWLTVRAIDRDNGMTFSELEEFVALSRRSGIGPDTPIAVLCTDDRPSRVALMQITAAPNPPTRPVAPVTDLTSRRDHP